MEKEESAKDKGLQMKTREIQFGGYNWTVKNSNNNKAGPGGNYWSNSEENILLDESGSLHMKITYKDGKWYCAEIYSNEYYGLGTYSFNVEGRPDLFDQNIVLGLFIYRDDDHEYDIELSTWGQSPANIDNAWFTVHPRPTAKVDSHSFRLSSIEECNTIHKIIWQEDQVIQFASYREHLTHDNILLEEDIKAWNYVDGRNYFRPENERVHMNLWLFNGNPPIDTKEVEIVIKSVQLPKNY